MIHSGPDSQVWLHLPRSLTLTGMTRSRSKKTSISARIIRSPTLVDRSTVVRTVHIRRTRTGRIGGATRAMVEVVPEADDAIPAPGTEAKFDGLLDESFDPQIDSPGDPTEEDHSAQVCRIQIICNSSESFIDTMLQYRPLQDWLPHRQEYLDELLRHDGRKGVASNNCSMNGCVNPGDFLCRDCMHERSFCQDCLVDMHRFLPLHRIMVSFVLALCRFTDNH
jgi:hypothetical protein